MAKIILGLTGPLASGKGTIKKYVVEKYGAKECRFSTILRDVASRLGVSNNRDNLQKISTALRQALGEDLLAKGIANDVKNFDSNIIVVDGVRRMADIQYLKEIPGFILASIDADPQIRFKRAVLRNENAGDDKKTFDQFIEAHQTEADRQVPDVMVHADLKINNDGTLEDLYKQVDEILKEKI